MLADLLRLVEEAKALAGGEHPCAALGHKWISQGGRHCCACGGSQSVYECDACGVCDYGEEGGPGWQDCQTYCGTKLENPDPCLNCNPKVADDDNWNTYRTSPDPTGP